MTDSDLTLTLDRIRTFPDPVFFVGSHKNSGKTTALMRFAQALAEEGSPMILSSIGRDGEAVDQLFGHRKPPVRVEPGWRFVTTGVATAEVPCELVAPLPAFVDGRQLGLFEARACGDVELWGPPAAAELRRTLEACARFEVGGRRPVLLVDGALDRQAALYHGPAGMILCCKAGAFPGPEAFGAWLAARRRLFLSPLHLGAPPATRLFEAGDLPESVPAGEVLVDGPLTQTLAEALVARGDAVAEIVVASPMHVFVDHATLNRLAPKLALLSAPDWFATVVNPAPDGSATDPDRTMAAARHALGPRHPVLDVLKF